MNKLTKLAAAVVLSSSVLAAFAIPVNAQTIEQSQELNQTISVTCSGNATGSYGQNVFIDCKAEGTQHGVQRQKVVVNGVECVLLKDKCIPTRKPENTSVNALTITGLIATAATTAGAGFLTMKKSK